MADFSISGRMKVKTLMAEFKKGFGGTLRVYNGSKFADKDVSLASIAKKKVGSGNDFKVRGNMKVGSFEKKVADDFGIKVQVADKTNEKLIDNKLTLSKI